MTIFVASNNATARTAAAISALDTTISLAVGQGDLFPNPASGTVFAATLSNASGTIREIVYCTARTGDVLTIQRGQEGTTPAAWPAATLIQTLLTNGVFEALAQWDLVAPFASVNLGSSGSAVINIMSDYDYKPARVTMVLTASVPTTLVNITGAWAGAQVSLLIAEGSEDISIPLNTPPFFVANIGSPVGWPGTEFDSITLIYVPANTSYKWLEQARNWRA